MRTTPVTYFVAENGSDHNVGSKEQPFLTLNRAREAIRESKRQTSAPHLVYIREGVYTLTEPLRFGAEDGGDVTYSSYPGEKAIVSGGKRVSGWEAHERRDGMTVWKTNVPDLDRTRHLYVNGRSAPRPRTEVRETSGWEKANDDRLQFWNLLETVVDYQSEKKVYEGYLAADREMLGWSRVEDIEFVFDVGWTHSICPVDAIEPAPADGEHPEGAVVRMRMPCFRDCQVKGGVQVGAPSYIENVFELLDEPGEWYFHRGTRVLYLVTRPDEDPNAMDVIVPYAEQLFVLEGVSDRPVDGLTFRGLTFSFTTSLRPAVTGHAEGQANLIKDPNNDMAHSSFLKMPAAVALVHTQHATFADSRFRQIGSVAIDLDAGTRNNRIVGNSFRDIAGSGVQIGGFTEQDAHPSDPRCIARDNVVRNNEFRGIGTEYKGSVAVIAGYTEGTAIEHNEITDVAYTGISVGWGWAYFDPDPDSRVTHLPPPDYKRYEKPTVAKRNRIAYNHIHRVMQKLHDGGGIYTLSWQPDSEIIGNYVHDNGFPGDVRYQRGVMVQHSESEHDGAKHAEYLKASGFPGGIYLDEGSGGFDVSGNLVHGVPVPIFYHDVIKERFLTNRFRDNRYHAEPGDPDFPEHIARKAGLEPEYRHLLLEE